MQIAAHGRHDELSVLHHDSRRSVIAFVGCIVEVRDVVLVHGFFVCFVLFSEALRYGVQVGVARGTLDKGDDGIVGF